MSQFYENSVFWIDVDKIHPNPFQPRREFDQAQLQSLADSIRQYGVLQALVVTRTEVIKEDGLVTEYELIAGERRLRASKIAGLSQVPVLIKVGDETDLMKLELAIIENVQREDLNPVDRAKAFNRLIEEFGFTHLQIAKKIGKSREYVSNTVRIVALPPEILDALVNGKISEGHTRPLMMLGDRPEEQMTVFKELLYKKLSVRETEAIARRIAYDKIRKKAILLDPEILELEEKLTESLGTRVSIERRENGGKISIDYFSPEDLQNIFDLLKNGQPTSPEKKFHDYILAPVAGKEEVTEPVSSSDTPVAEIIEVVPVTDIVENPDDRSPEEIKTSENTEDEIYSIKNFSI